MEWYEVLSLNVTATLVIVILAGALVHRSLRADMREFVGLCVESATGKEVKVVEAKPKPPKKSDDDLPDDPDAYDPILCGRRG